MSLRVILIWQFSSLWVASFAEEPMTYMVSFSVSLILSSKVQSIGNNVQSKNIGSIRSIVQLPTVWLWKFGDMMKENMINRIR